MRIEGQRESGFLLAAPSGKLGCALFRYQKSPVDELVDYLGAVEQHDLATSPLFLLEGRLSKPSERNEVPHDRRLVKVVFGNERADELVQRVSADRRGGRFAFGNGVALLEPVVGGEIELAP